MVMMMSKVGVHCVRACPPPLKRRFKNNICRAECNRASRTAGVVRPLRRRYGFSGAGVAGRAPRIALAGSTQEDGEPAPSSTEDIENLIRAKRRKSPIDERMQRSLGARVAGDDEDEDEDEDELTLEQRVWRNWAGEKGVLYWMNKLATGGLVVMVIAWIFIRFIGPGLGLYTVVDPFADMPPPPMR